MIKTLPEICAALEQSGRGLADYAASLSETACFASRHGRWSPAGHFGHLQAVYRAVTRGLGQTERLPGHSSQQSRSHEAVQKHYRQTLKTAPQSFLRNNPFVSRLEPELGVAKLARDFLAAGKALREVAATWSETALDQKAMNHPLMGELTVREMLLFIHYHDLHHLAGLKARQAQKESV